MGTARDIEVTVIYNWGLNNCTVTFHPCGLFEEPISDKKLNGVSITGHFGANPHFENWPAGISGKVTVIKGKW